MLDFNSFAFFADLFPLLFVVLPVYRRVQSVVARRLLLGALGVCLLWLVAPRLAVFYLGFWAIVYGVQRIVARTAEKRFGTWVFGAGIVLVLSPMVIWKLAATTFVVKFNLWNNALVGVLPGSSGAVDLARDIVMPLGLSFTTFRAIDLIVKTYLGMFDRLRGDEVFFYGFFPPVLLIGPVIQYTDIKDAVNPGRSVVWDDARSAVLLVIGGLFKVFVLSYPLQSSAQMFVYYRTNSTPVLWLELAMFALYFLFNFSGYSDLAVGAAKLIGFDIQRNFNWPYTKTNPQDFWNSWHMSLTHFFQRNVFVPFGGMRAKSQYRAIFLTIMAIALWHDISIPLVIFGLYHATGLIGHRWLRERRPVAESQPARLRAGKALMQFAYFSFSLPLMVISRDQIVPVYSSLLGLS